MKAGEKLDVFVRTSLIKRSSIVFEYVVRAKSDGRLVAQAALGHAPDFPLAPYALSRFAEHRLLTGRYGAGAVS